MSRPASLSRASRWAGGQVERGQRAHRRPQPAHGGGGRQPVSRGVADDERHPAADQRDDVEPVAADLGAVAGRQIAVGEPHPRLLGQRPRQQAALQGERGVPLPGVEAGVVQRDPGPGGELHGQRQVLAVEGRTVSAAGDHQQPEHRAAGPQRHGDQRVDVEFAQQLRDARVVRAGGPQLGPGLGEVGRAGVEHRPQEGADRFEGRLLALPQGPPHVGAWVDGREADLEQRAPRPVVGGRRLPAGGHQGQQLDAGQVREAGHDGVGQRLADPPHVEQVGDGAADVVEQGEPLPGPLDLGLRVAALGDVEHDVGDPHRLAGPVGDPPDGHRARPEPVG